MIGQGEAPGQRGPSASGIVDTDARRRDDLPDRGVIGVLIITSHDHHGFSTPDLRTARDTAERAARGILRARSAGTR